MLEPVRESHCLLARIIRAEQRLAGLAIPNKSGCAILRCPLQPGAPARGSEFVRKCCDALVAARRYDGILQIAGDPLAHLSSRAVVSQPAVGFCRGFLEVLETARERVTLRLPALPLELSLAIELLDSPRFGARTRPSATVVDERVKHRDPVPRGCNLERQRATAGGRLPLQMAGSSRPRARPGRRAGV